MTTNNSVNAPFPLSPVQGGSGLNSPTAHGVLVSEGAANFNPIVLGVGQTLIGTTSGDPAAATLTAGAGISITPATGAITIAATGLGGFTWTDVTGTTQAMVANNGYIADNAGLVSFTLPTTAAQGTLISVCGNGAGGWTILQNALQSIKFGSVTTTTGTGGSLSSTNLHDQVDILCTVANTTWVVRSSVGNLTYV
jgi:hypothetical protein